MDNGELKILSFGSYKTCIAVGFVRYDTIGHSINQCQILVTRVLLEVNVKQDYLIFCLLYKLVRCRPGLDKLCSEVQRSPSLEVNLELC